MTYAEWRIINGCDHAHCPFDCEHPQPFFWLGRLWCGACFFEQGALTVMQACAPSICE